MADLKDFPQAGYFGYWLGMAPDDSPFCFATWAPRKSMPSIGKRFSRKDFLPLIESDVPILKQAEAEYAKLQ